MPGLLEMPGASLGVADSGLGGCEKGLSAMPIYVSSGPARALSGASTAIVATSLVKREGLLKPTWQACVALRMPEWFKDVQGRRTASPASPLQSSCQFSIGAATQGTWLTGNHPKVS